MKDRFKSGQTPLSSEIHGFGISIWWENQGMFLSNKNQQNEVLFSLKEYRKKQGKRKNMNVENIPCPFASAQNSGWSKEAGKAFLLVILE